MGLSEAQERRFKESGVVFAGSCRVTRIAMTSIRLSRPLMIFPDDQGYLAEEYELDLSPDDEEEEEETRLGAEEEEDPYEYDDELPGVPHPHGDGSSGPNSLDDDLILEGKQHRQCVAHHVLCVYCSLLALQKHTENYLICNFTKHINGYQN